MTSSSLTSAVGTFGLTAVGGYLFGPVGFAAGALLGSFLFGQGGADVEGPRLGDLNVSASSTYGGVIPKCYAVQKVAGQMIWATPIDEDKHTRKVGGGLFGGGQKIREYKYYANFAVLFAEGECAGLLRLWVGEKLIADMEAPPVDTSSFDSLPDAMKYFIGNERYKFRFPTPPVTAEIAWASSDAQPIRAMTPIAGGGIFGSTSFQLGSEMLDARRHRFYVRTTAAGGGIRRFDLLTGAEDFQVLASDRTWSSGSECGTVDLDGHIYMASDTGNDLVKVDGDSLVEIARTTALFGYADMDCGHAFTLSGFVPVIFAATSLGSARIVRGDLMLFLHSGSGGDRIAGVVRGREDLGACEGWYGFNATPTPTGTITLRRYKVSASASPAAGITFKDWVFTPADFGGSTNIWFGSHFAYEAADDSIIFTVRMNGATDTRLVKFSEAGGIKWVQDGFDQYEIPRKAQVRKGKLALWLQASLNATIRIVDTASGAILTSQPGWSSLAGARTFYDPATEMMINAHASGIHQAWPGRVNRSAAQPGAVVTDLCGRVGIPPEDLDVGELTDSVRGFGIARQVSVRGALELLAATYHFDGAESDYQLKLKKRGRSSLRVIGESELAPINERGEVFLETRAQDVDLPVRFTVRYHDLDRDADVGTQTVKRIIEPTPTVQSQNEATLDLPLTLTAQEAKAVALRHGFTPWLERTMHEWALSWAHIDLDPGDVVTFAQGDGRAFVVRILRIDIGANLELRLETVVEESSSYDVSALASGGLGYRPEVVAPTDFTQLILADSPLLADGDDAERKSSGLYWAIGGIGQPGWAAGVLFESLDGA